jgi:hypothetical protein
MTMDAMKAALAALAAGAASAGGMVCQRGVERRECWVEAGLVDRGSRVNVTVQQRRGLPRDRALVCVSQAGDDGKRRGEGVGLTDLCQGHSGLGLDDDDRIGVLHPVLLDGDDRSKLSDRERGRLLLAGPGVEGDERDQDAESQHRGREAAQPERDGTRSRVLTVAALSQCPAL